MGKDGKDASTIIGGLVTFDTPFLGSPFGYTSTARAMEPILGRNLRAAWPLPPSGTDGSICLAPHDRKISLPSGCKDIPYLPVSAPLTQLAGDVSISRKLFMFDLGDIDLGNDGIVDSNSSQGYLESGARTERARPGSQVASRLERCTMGFDKILAVAIARGIIERAAPGQLVHFLSTLKSGSDALSHLNGQQKPQEPALQQALAVTLGASCSHINILSDTHALDDTATALQAYIQKLGKPVDDFAPFIGIWQGHGATLVVQADRSGTYTWNKGPCPDDPSHMCIGQAKIQFSESAKGISGEIRTVEPEEDTEDGLFVGNTVRLQRGPQPDVVQLVVKGSSGNPNLCGPRADRSTDVCGA
ncbi:hypothetical protein [Streptomyces sp. TLI_185]|uniref:hypothetical protein n=1 Tax=Streptomyces sp. TLI_185 TaxID=2485151 RepID=UPI000F501109|nr:hypothetical protein [Streptomyces sp. TLI_185]RPF39360.1 hypothetical protein EDD92_9610 [Streptomyces sp. TLI_185]